VLKKILIILLLTGCTKKIDKVKTIIKENNNCIISINYPITKYKKLNKEIKKDIKKIYKDFKKNHCKENDIRTELNIDFEQEIINTYISTKLKISTNDTIEYKTYNYDNNKKIKIFDILTENDIDILTKKLEIYIRDNKINTNILNNIKDLDYNINNNYLFLHLDNKNILNLDLELFDLKFKIENNIKQKYTYKEINKILNPNKKTIAITFDDGPSKYTKLIVDLLKEYNSNATFFVLGNKVEIYKDTLKYLLDNGNEIGNHSYNHKCLTSLTTEELLDQINKTQSILQENLNYTPTLIRPTYGLVNKNVKENTNLDIILWNIDTLDWKYKNSKKISQNSLNKIKDGSIILMHDTYEYTYNALKLMLPKLIEEDYQLVTVTELKNIMKLRNENKK